MSACAQLQQRSPRSYSGLRLPEQLEAAIREVAELTSRSGGATFSFEEGSLAGRELYAVATAPHRTVITHGAPALPEIRKFVLANLDLLARPHHHIGTWVDKRSGRGYLDVSLSVESRAVALRLAHLTHQKAIFNLHSMKEEYLEAPQRR